MLKEKRCKELFAKVIALRDLTETDSVESYNHALYGFVKTDSGYECTQILDGPDVYDILRKARIRETTKVWNNIILYTEGWAAPADKDKPNLPPSQHPEAKKVKLACFIDESLNVESIICLEGEELRYDATGAGRLADALKEMYFTTKEENDNINDKSFYI